MQLRLVTGLTEQEYVSRRAWQRASLAACPLHGQCCRGFSRHGTYVRKSVNGEARVALVLSPEPGYDFVAAGMLCVWSAGIALRA